MESFAIADVSADNRGFDALATVTAWREIIQLRRADAVLAVRNIQGTCDHFDKLGHVQRSFFPTDSSSKTLFALKFRKIHEIDCPDC